MEEHVSDLKVVKGLNIAALIFSIIAAVFAVIGIASLSLGWVALDRYIADGGNSGGYYQYDGNYGNGNGIYDGLGPRGYGNANQTGDSSEQTCPACPGCPGYSGANQACPASPNRTALSSVAGQASLCGAFDSGSGSGSGSGSIYDEFLYGYGEGDVDDMIDDMLGDLNNSNDRAAAEASTAIVMAILIALLVWEFLIAVFSIVTAVLALRSCKTHAHMKADFVLAIVAASLSLLCLNLATMVLFILSAVFLHRARRHLEINPFIGNRPVDGTMAL